MTTTDDISRARLESVEVFHWLAKPGTRLCGVVAMVSHHVDLTDPSLDAQPVWLVDVGADRLHATAPPVGHLRDQLEAFRLKPGDLVNIVVDKTGHARVAVILQAERTREELHTILEEGVAAIMPDGMIYRGPERKAGAR